VSQPGYLAEGPAVQGPDQATRCRHGKGGKGGWWWGEGKRGRRPEGSAHALSNGFPAVLNAHAQSREWQMRARLPAGERSRGRRAPRRAVGARGAAVCPPVAAERRAAVGGGDLRLARGLNGSSSPGFFFHGPALYAGCP